MKNSLKIFVLLLVFSTGLGAQSETGSASYYNDKYHGARTYSGEKYDKNAFTCAHKTYPMGTYLKVTRLTNEKSVVVKVNDRMSSSSRVIDLSKAAAIELDLIRSGTSKVRLEVVKPEDIPTEPLASNEQPQSESTKPAVEEVLTPKGGQNALPTPPVVEPKKQAFEEATAKTVVKPEKSTSEPATATPIALPVAFNPAEYEPSDLLEFKLNKPEKKGFGVQIAVLSSDEALFKMIGEMEEDWFSSILVMVQQDAKEMSTYKLILGPFDTEEAASNYKDNLKKNKKMDGFVVDLAGLDAKK